MDEHEVMYIPIEEKIHVSNDMKMDEMLHISLKPNIIMQMKHDFILLKGDLILQGNYRLLEGEQVFDRKEPQMEQVQLLGDDKAMFLHGFPIEIAIEKSKVKNIDDISMQMEMFDYTLVDPVTIHVTANVMIQGIDQSEETTSREESMAENASAYREEELSLQEDLVELDPIKDDQSSKQINKEDSGAEANIKAPSNQEEALSQARAGTMDAEIEKDHTEQETEEEEIQSETSLFDLLFLNGDQTEQQTKIKMYIAQEEDYLEKIAERYDLSVYQLMNDNELTEDILEVGQILKIREEK